MQIFNKAIPNATNTPNMSGFVQNYMNQNPSCKPKNIMHYFSPEQIPVLSTLARQFAVCDCWHASAPCQTWPNRFFIHTGTANGYENNSPNHFPYEMPTIYNRFEDNGTILRPDGNIPFDHTSILSTLRKRFDLGSPLSDRDAIAPTLEGALSLNTPDNLGPEQILPLNYEASTNDIQNAATGSLNDMQKNLVELAKHIPEATLIGNFEEFIKNHIENLKIGNAKTSISIGNSISEAITFIKQRLFNFMHKL